MHLFLRRYLGQMHDHKHDSSVVSKLVPGHESCVVLSQVLSERGLGCCISQGCRQISPRGVGVRWLECRSEDDGSVPVPGIFIFLLRLAWCRLALSAFAYDLRDVVAPVWLRCARHLGTIMFSLCMTSWYPSGYAVPDIVSTACLIRCARHRGTGLVTLCKTSCHRSVYAVPDIVAPVFFRCA